MSRQTYGLNLDNLPQDPFYPQENPRGPSFLDTAGCLCALQVTTAGGAPEPAWHCVGDQSVGVYTVRNGRWFKTLNGVAGNADGPVYDASNPPDTGAPMRWLSGALRDSLGDAGLSVEDGACTGENNTRYSTSFYEAAGQINAGQYPLSGAPCLRPGAVPIEIQPLQSWLEDGCRPGFLCENNTVNSLPQYCPPLGGCQQARLAGFTCTFEGKNIGMGPFEPVICQAGHYCPAEENGKVSRVCPAGHYCQPGAATPTPCLTGSRCPEGSSYELFLIPFIILIIVDVLLIVGMIVYKVRQRFQDRQANKAASTPASAAAPVRPPLAHRGMSSFRAQITGYRAISDNTDREMLPAGATYTPRRTDSYGGGFLAALDLDPGSRSRSRSSVPARPTSEQLNPQLMAFVSSMRRATDVTHFGLSFRYADLGFQPRKSARKILHNVTGSIDRGTLTAVMGGSGAGKSTFVNVLMGKTKNTGGTVAVNGGGPDKLRRYRKVIGYVPQDDIVLPELTVRENIVHCAEIRLPRTWSRADVDSHAESVIDCLELSHVRHSLVGSVARPVISGGQRKRVSIGMELAAAPMAIFLDEPTSGLDATAASSMMSTLKAVARLGITVIVVIHQPRAEIFDLFDNLILLGNGQTIYEGAQSRVQDYFEGLGFVFPTHSNHGDVVTDIITGNGRDYKRTTGGGDCDDISTDSLVANWSSHRRLTTAVTDKEQRPASSVTSNAGMYAAIKHRGAPLWKQTWLCLRRAMLQQWRTKAAFLAEMGLAALAGFLLGLAEHSKKGILFVGTFNEPYAILSTAVDFKSAPELALLVAIAIGLVAGAPGVKSFSEELLTQRREAEAGHSRPAYFLAKVLAVLPRMLFACLHFTALLFLLAVPVIDWGLAFLVNALYFYCIYGLASIVSMLVRREDAPLFATMISLIVAILSGAAPPLARVKDWHMEWLWRASPGTWLAEIYFGQLVSPFGYLYNVESAARGSGFHLDWVWRNMGVLVGIGSVYRVVAFFAMLFGHRRWR
ncbi:ABC transporter G family member 24 [Colletotrichum tanaceti]|uniref:ABC transporter G family member 24 n=1 Tax=Colletotrichum tanaceti TaxID=1306861 RepID=A0A4U6XHI8_9PEZI|nr:ABC transporter G family member 24 [Colletotrichum tanaceti]KAJ0168385.1 ABC transporter G family member 24 [Colletotrichum tanaceti]TKW55380.1 ABC transporter G family member 24 [Colletotrichum tanaceti]